MTTDTESAQLQVTQDEWRWSARELAADTELVIVAAIARLPRRSVTATLSVEDDFRDLSDAYRRLQSKPFDQRQEDYRQRMIRLLEHRLEDRDIEGVAWAVRVTGLAPDAGAGSGRHGEAVPRMTRGRRIREAVEDWPEHVASLSEEQRQELERLRFWPEFTILEDGLTITSPEVSDERAVECLNRARRLIAAGILKPTNGAPRDDYFDPATGLSLADPELPEERAVVRLLEVRAIEAITEQERQAEIRAAPPYNTFADMGWPREPVIDLLDPRLGALAVAEPVPPEPHKVAQPREDPFRPFLPRGRRHTKLANDDHSGG